MNSFYLVIFLIAISATVITSLHKTLNYQSQQPKDKETIHSTSVLKYVTIVGTILITAIITSASGFEVFEWSLFGLLSLAGIGLAYFNQKLYGFVPLLSATIIAAMLINWSTVDSVNFAIVISIFSMLYIVSGYFIQNICLKPLKWSILTCSTAMIYYIIAYYKLKHAVFLAVIPHLWSMLALLFAICSLYALQRVINYLPKKHSQKQHLMASYALTVTAFIALSFAVEIPKGFLYIALSAEILAIAWINTRLDIKALRYIAIALSCVVAFLFIPQILLIIQLSAYNLVEAKILSLKNIPSLASPILQLGLPALLLGLSSYFFRLKKDDKFVQYLELSSIALISIMGYYFIRSIFHNNEEAIFIKTSFFERGITTNIIFLFGLLCLTLGRKLKRDMISMSGLVLSLASTFRILYFDCFLHNPVWTLQEVGSLPILNAILITYGLPILWTWQLYKELLSLKKLELAKYSNYFMLFTSFIFVSLNIRQIFQGPLLNGKVTSITEIYTYSVVWIVFGIALLFIGTLRNSKMIRVASLIIMILTIGKVFLYDTSKLEGLYRVFSFFGLGISLLALSSFYSRFVFNQKKAPKNI